MAIVMLHHFPEEDFYKISYTGKDSVPEFEKQQKLWIGREYSLVWSKEFSNVDTAKLLKKEYSKSLKKYHSSFIKSSTDTFKSDNPPELGEVKESETRPTRVHLVKFTYNEETLYKVGYSVYMATTKYAKLTDMQVIWDVAVTGEAVAKRFVAYVLGKYPKVPVALSYIGRGLVIDSPLTIEELTKKWLKSEEGAF